MKRKIFFTLYLLMGLLFINAGLNKLLNYIPAPSDLPERLQQMGTAMMQIGWLLPLVAIAEITGGILFIFGRTRPLGAIILFPVILGILLTHITVAPSGLPMAIALVLVDLWVIYENRPKYLYLIKKN